MESTDPQRLEELIARCALGDQAAFTQLYQSVGSKLNGIAYRIMGNTDCSNEILQEAFIQIWNNSGQYRADKAEPMTWMASLVRYRAYDRIRRSQRRIEGSQIKADLDNLDEIESPQTGDVQLCELNQELENCLATLEEQQRKSVLMAYYYGFSRDEIAKELETPMNTVKSWVKRGIVRLQQCLST